MKTIQNVSYGRARSEANLLDLYLPDGPAPRAMIYFHGGGLEGGDKADARVHAEALTGRGVALVSANYRLYPEAKFPDFIEDAAQALRKAMNLLQGEIYVGGSSAGAYLAMMLFLDRRWLDRAGVDATRVRGWLFDAAQPTTHFNVLRERGMDPRLVRLDEAAPMYFVSPERFAGGEQPRVLVLAADRDIPGRLEQNLLLIRTMEAMGFPSGRIRFLLMENSGHCEYDDKPVFARLMGDFVCGELSAEGHVDGGM